MIGRCRRLLASMVPVALDVTDPESIARACSTMRPWLEQATQVVLVNNAGWVMPGPLELLSMAQLRDQFEVNVFGQLALTQALLPWLRRADVARVIMVSSIAGQVAFPMMGAYCASKHALEALSGSLRMELTPWRIPVVVVAPGSVQTPLWQKTFARLDSDTQWCRH
jgi:NAD(P)-dependent dehydrogenase (short-subunit alcohol dehydrogenase family)